MNKLKNALFNVYCFFRWHFLSLRRRAIERRLNDALLIHGVISESDAAMLVPDTWEIAQHSVEISSWSYGWERKQYPLKVLPKK